MTPRPVNASSLLVSILCLVLSGCGGAKQVVEAPSATEHPPQGKLPEGVRPTSYRLSLTIVPAEDSFTGTVAIDIELAEPAASIWMHGQGLEVTSVHALHEGTRIEASWKQRTLDGVARVEFRETLPAGRTTLHIEYSAGFDTPLRGLYRVKTGERTYAFTQFESIGARLAFPCFDEPRFKTPFDVTLTIPGDQFAAANTPVERAIRIPDGLQRIHFRPTLPLPTYVVAWAVGPLDIVSAPSIPPGGVRPYPIPLRGIAANGKGERLRYALQRTARFVVALEEYFGIPYPYRKLDLVAVPDFGAGAMENVGLITFREWLLLIDERRATENQRRAFAYVMAHELAHQWFGNLVTMPWWDDIWLNEAFATWMGSKVVQALHPEYRTDLGSLGSSHRAMKLDSLTSARSIRQPVENTDDIMNAFDAITYEKGGAVLGMFERWIGPDPFREGIRLYLQRHQGRTATAEDLLNALNEASDRDITAAFRSFLTQPGVPLVKGDSPLFSGVRKNGRCEPGSATIELSQERYLPIGSSGDPNQTWQIPICVRTDLGSTCGLLESRKGTIELPGCPTWWMPNDEGKGYFRFSLSADDWTRLRTKGFAKLSDRGRMAVADSVLAAFDQGSMDAEELLPWLRRFAASPLRQVATAPMGHLRFMMYDAAPSALRSNVASHAASFYRKRYRELGWRTRKGDSGDTKLLRESLIRFLAMDVRDPAVRARAARLGKAHVGYQTKANRRVVEPQLAGLVLGVAVQENGAELFDHLLALLESGTDATLRNRVLTALAHAETPELAERALALSLDPRLRVNEIGRVLWPQFRNPRTRERAWEWFTEHFDEVAARFGSYQVGGMPWYASSFCSKDAAAKVQEFFGPKVARLAGGTRNLAGSVERISLCAARAEAQRPSVARAFSAR